MFRKLYLDSTNPKLTLFEFFGPNILKPIILSILFHTIIYTLFCNLTSWIFLGKNLSGKICIRLILSLIVIMFFGFIGRFIHVKDIYKSYNENIEKTREYIDKHYITWIFLS